MNQECSTIQSHLLQTLTESDARHLGTCQHCARTLRQAIGLEAAMNEHKEENRSMEDEMIFSRTEERTAALIRRSRVRRAIRQTAILLTITIIGVSGILWLFVSGVMMGRSATVHPSRAAVLARNLPVIFTSTVVLGFLFALAISRVRRVSSSRLRNTLAWAAGLALCLGVEYRVAKTVATEHPEYFWLPLAAAMFTAAAISYLGSMSGFPYKRLSGRRQVSGVCLGLAEANGWSLALIRLLFVAAIFLNLHGVLLYFAFYALMEVHPDDRGQLLRFRIARWLRHRFAGVEA